jgi:phenylpropionate dioxygenase-like ring-hydroxylating dioxygenase large terminal subunit
MFLRNFWYVAASINEVTRKPLGRTILGEPIVFFRKEDGTPVAIEDRCVHRHLPLSMGKLVGDLLQCHYHGLRYDSAGQCGEGAGPEHRSAGRPGQILSGGGAPSLAVDMDG